MAEETEITITIKEYDDFDYIRENLKNVLYLPQFCGICFKGNEDLFDIDVEFELVTHRKTEVKALKDIIGYIFNNQVSIVEV